MFTFIFICLCVYLGYKLLMLFLQVVCDISTACCSSPLVFIVIMMILVCIFCL